VARKRRLTIALPDVVWDALYAEGSRIYERPAIVAERVLTDALADYVAVQLRRDLSRSSERPVRSSGVADPTAPTDSAPSALSDDPKRRSDALG
jgi:hypothetical protein